MGMPIADFADKIVTDLRNRYMTGILAHQSGQGRALSSPGSEAGAAKGPAEAHARTGRPDITRRRSKRRAGAQRRGTLEEMVSRDVRK